MDEPTAAPNPPAGSGGRRCHVTVLFSDVSDSSRHAEELEAEEYAALLERFRAFVHDVMPRHGGSVARLQGDGMLALFGHQGAREDDGRRAAEAALELHDAVARLRVHGHRNARTLQLHSGIHAGLLLLLEGDIERGRFDVVGEVANTAARLCSLAGAGQILVSAGTLGPQAHFFDVTRQSRIEVRGRSAPLDVLHVVGRAQVARRIDAAARRGVVPFVGRDDALARLLHKAQQRDGQRLVHVSGEPGVGKTRLLDEFQQRLAPQDYLVVQGSCESYLGAQPLQPFLQGLRRILAADELPPPTLAPADRAAAIADRLARSAGARTLVLILDDWQWADDASRATLHAVLARFDALLVVLAARSGGLDDDALALRAEALPLQPLDAAAGERAAQAWLPSADPFLVQEIGRRSGGSPLFLEELCHAALAGGDVTAAPGARGVAWLDSLVASRLQRLPHDQAEALQLASVVGNIVALPLLQRLLGERAVGLAQRLVEHDFLMPNPEPDTLRFRHALTRDAVYATVDVSLRRGWHLRVAQTLEAAGDAQATDDSLEALAYHYHAADRSEQAAHFAVAAGDKALTAMALDRARAHYLTALRALDTLPMLSRPMQLQWCSIAQRLGQTCVFDPLDMSESSAMFERAVALAGRTGDVNALARAEYWMAYVNYGRGRPRDAIRSCEAALAHAREADDARLVTQMQATLGQSLASAGRYGEALPLLEEAVRNKGRQARAGSGAAIGSAYSLARMAYTHGDLGNFERAHALFGEALALLGGTMHQVRASISELICAVHLWQGRWQEARDAGLAGSDIALRCRSRYLTAMGRALGGCAVWALQRDEAALRALRDATHWIEARGGAVSTSINLGWLVEAAVELGHYDEARAHATLLVRRARLQDRHGHAMGCRALARWRVATGRPARARAHLAAADRSAALRASRREQALNAMAWGELALATGDVATARARFDAAAEAFTAMQMNWHLARAHELAASIEGG